MRAALAHAEFCIWVTTAVKAANKAWEARTGGHLMERGGMHYFLYRWGVETGRIIPNPRRVQSYLVAQVFAREPETVKAAARGYWYECIKAVKCA